MIKSVIKFFATKVFIGSFFNWISNNILLFFLPIITIFSAFYIPYEYEKYLEFKLKFPYDELGIYLNILRPAVIFLTILVVLKIIYSHKKRIEAERLEELKRIEQEKLEKIEREKASLQKIQELRDTTVVKTAEKVVSKEGVGAATGGVVGGVIGSSLGIAGFGTAIAGTLPVAIIGATIGYLGMKLWKKRKK